MSVAEPCYWEYTNDPDVNSISNHICIAGKKRSICSPRCRKGVCEVLLARSGLWLAPIQHLINNILTNKDKNFLRLITKAKESLSIWSHHHSAFVSLSEAAISSFDYKVMRNMKKRKKKEPSGLLRRVGDGLSCTFISLYILLG